MSTAGDAGSDRTSSAVPADLRAYSQAAVQIDDEIHQLAQRLGRVFDAYRATKPEFGPPLPRIEDDLERYARRCLDIDHRVGQVADAFEKAGRDTLDDAALESALADVRRAEVRATQPPPKPRERHEDGGVLGFLGGLKDDAIHAVEHPLDTVANLTGHVVDSDLSFLKGFADGMGELATAAWMLSRVLPVTPSWYFSMATDPAGTVQLQETFARGLLHMAADPVGTLSTMIDAKDLESGDVFRWAGHITPQIALTLATAGAGAGADAAAAAAEGIGEAAGGEAVATGGVASTEEAARALGGAAATGTPEEVAGSLATAAEQDAAAEADAAARRASGWRGPDAESPRLPHSADQPLDPSEWPVDDSGYRLQPRDLDFLGYTRQQIAWVVRREAPLGMTPEQFVEFRTSLLDALRRDGIDAGETDVRLHGSGANVYSGIHKSLPTAAELADNPETLARLRDWLGDDPNRPLRRPFDSMHRLGMDEPSDYDINISSDRMMEIARGRWDPDEFDGPMLKGHGYLEKEFMRTVFPQLQGWADLWTSRLGRDISHAVFDSKGPFDTSHIGQGISVHFRDETDWIMHSPGRH